MPDAVIRSPNTLRTPRLPPGQVQTVAWPPEPGTVPPFDPLTWDLALFPVPLVSAVKRFAWPEFEGLSRVKVLADFHSEAGWSKLDNFWEGVSTRELLNHVRVHPDVKFVMVHCEQGFTANLPLDEFLADDALFALKHDGAPILPELGFPVRLIVPGFFALKSPRWVRGVEFMTHDHPSTSGA